MVIAGQTRPYNSYHRLPWQPLQQQQQQQQHVVVITTTSTQTYVCCGRNSTLPYNNHQSRRKALFTYSYGNTCAHTPLRQGSDCRNRVTARPLISIRSAVLSFESPHPPGGQGTNSTSRFSGMGRATLPSDAPLERSRSRREMVPNDEVKYNSFVRRPLCCRENRLFHSGSPVATVTIRR